MMEDMMMEKKEGGGGGVSATISITKKRKKERKAKEIGCQYLTNGLVKTTTWTSKTTQRIFIDK